MKSAKVLFILFLSTGLFITFSTDSPRAATWSKTYGVSQWDEAYGIQQTGDGGYIVAGYSHDDLWISKLDSSGNDVWQRRYGGGDGEKAFSVSQTSDGGYIAAGASFSFGVGSADMWILKFDASGDLSWHKTYGDIWDDRALSIQQTKDGGYIVGGMTVSFESGTDGIWILKLDHLGGVIWQKIYDGAYPDQLTFIRQSADGGYIVAGSTGSFGAGSIDMLAMKLDGSGKIIWQKTYGGPYSDLATSVLETTGGNYVLVGNTSSSGAGGFDIVVLKLDGFSGKVLWQKTYGDISDEGANSIWQTSDKGYVVAGFTELFGENQNILILKLDSLGEIIWQRPYWMNPYEGVASVQQTTDGGYILAGYTASTWSKRDVWLWKLDGAGKFQIGGCSAIQLKTSSASAADSTLTAADTAFVVKSTSASVQSSYVTAAYRPISKHEICPLAEITVPLPSGRFNYSYTAVETPVKSNDPSFCAPFACGGLSDLVTIRDIIDFQIGLPMFAGPVDIYLALSVPTVKPGIYIIKPDLSLQPISKGFVPWKAGATGPIMESLYGSIPSASLPSATYYLYVVVTPAGSTKYFYMWDTSFINFHLVISEMMDNF